MTLLPRQRIRNSYSGGMRPSSLLLGHGGSPQYWLFTSEKGRNFLFLWNLNACSGLEPAISDFPSSQLWSLHQGPRLEILAEDKTPITHSISRSGTGERLCWYRRRIRVNLNKKGHPKGGPRSRTPAQHWAGIGSGCGVIPCEHSAWLSRHGTGSGLAVQSLLLISSITFTLTLSICYLRFFFSLNWVNSSWLSSVWV